MAAQVEGPSSTKSLLRFRSPDWYHSRPRPQEGDDYCRTHYVCRQVDRDLRLLHNKPPLKKDDDYYYDDIDDEEEEGDIVYPINIFSDQEKEVEEQSHNQNKKKNKQEEEEEEKKEKKGVIDYSVKLVGPDHRAMKEKWTIQMGRKKYNLRQLLSSPSRDYLIKFNGDKVSIDQLSGKHVLLYFWYLSAGKLGNKIFNTDLEEVFKIYNSQGEFKETTRLFFMKHFPACRGLPFHTKIKKPEIVTKFVVTFSPFGRASCLKTLSPPSALMDPRAFPTPKKKKMDQIEREDNAICKQPSSKELSSSKLSLTALLGDYLISSEGSHVSQY